METFASAVLPVGEIKVGHRFRIFEGDLSGLVESIRQVGLLHPLLVSADGVLLCGARRLAAVKELKWRRVAVLVVPASSQLTALLAEHHENEHRLALLPTEQAALYAELKTVYAADARSRRTADATTTSAPAPAGGGEDSSRPASAHGRSALRAALAVTGKLSFQRLEQVRFIQRAAEDESLPQPVRQLAQDKLREIDGGAPTDPRYQEMRVAVHLATHAPEPTSPAVKASEDEVAELSRQALAVATERRAQEIKAQAARRLAAKPVRRHPRALVFTWREIAGTAQHYDVDAVAHDVSDADWQAIQGALAEWTAFLDQVAAARAALREGRVLSSSGVKPGGRNPSRRPADTALVRRRLSSASPTPRCEAPALSAQARRPCRSTTDGMATSSLAVTSSASTRISRPRR